jgi:hypothetical protein
MPLPDLMSRPPSGRLVAPVGALADQLRAATEQFAQLATVFNDTAWASLSPIAGLSIGQGVHALLHDAYVHGDDIRAALGRPFDPGPGLYASLDFVLVATGRLDPDRLDMPETINIYR